MKTLDKISIRLAAPLLNKVKEKAAQNQQRLSDYIRHLIELGLRVEELQNAPAPEKKLEALAFKSLLENVMLTRAMLRNASHIDKEIQEEYLQKARERAVKTVKKFWGEDCLVDEN